jgi:thiamine-monophosphate kinase
VGELELVRRIREAVGDPGPDTRIGIGDDAAVLEASGELQVFTCDAFVEGVHFRREFAPLADIGAKCLVATMSDVAAMGGFPAQATVALCVPPYLSESEIMELYGGMLAAASRHGAEIVGGDIVSSLEGLVISIALLGAVGRERVMTRRGAVVGDAVVVTGSLGASAAGLAALLEGLPDEPAIVEAKRRHLAPDPRLAEAQALLDVAKPHAMIDVSDGLSSDVMHIAEESGLGIALVERDIPVAPSARVVAERLGRDPVQLALASGEEFELLVTLPQSEVERATEHLSAVTGTRLTRIGEVVDEASGCTLLRDGGESIPLVRSGYEHLAGINERGDGR